MARPRTFVGSTVRIAKNALIILILMVAIIAGLVGAIVVMLAQ